MAFSRGVNDPLGSIWFHLTKEFPQEFNIFGPHTCSLFFCYTVYVFQESQGEDCLHALCYLLTQSHKLRSPWRK